MEAASPGPRKRIAMTYPAIPTGPPSSAASMTRRPSLCLIARTTEDHRRRIVASRASHRALNTSCSAVAATGAAKDMEKGARTSDRITVSSAQRKPPARPLITAPASRSAGSRQ
nr:hypothetical protein [Faecalibaculum rodentium]